MHLITSWCPQGTSKQQNNSTAGKVLFWANNSKDVESFSFKLSGLLNLFISVALKFLHLSMMNDVNSTRPNLAIVTTYKLILVTAFQSEINWF